MKQQSEEIPKHLFRLLSMCPAEAHDSKRDLLQTGRAALNHPETRIAFSPYAPTMMDIKNFAGDIPLNQRHIRQISYAFLGILFHLSGMSLAWTILRKPFDS